MGLETKNVKRKFGKIVSEAWQPNPKDKQPGDCIRLAPAKLACRPVCYREKLGTTTSLIRGHVFTGNVLFPTCGHHLFPRGPTHDLAT
jgi:hypothetical protein